jgi:hypothetical protein
MHSYTNDSKSWLSILCGLGKLNMYTHTMDLITVVTENLSLLDDK